MTIYFLIRIFIVDEELRIRLKKANFLEPFVEALGTYSKNEAVISLLVAMLNTASLKENDFYRSRFINKVLFLIPLRKAVI